MAKAALTDPIFNDETKAREWLEARLWPNGPICPRCGVVDEATLMKGKSHRPGLYQCNACREPFTVTVGTLYERSKIPLNKWLAATYLLQSSKKGISALQIHRTLGVSKKTAWFLMHRIRESLRPAAGAKFGGNFGGVEVDETLQGIDPRRDHEADKRANPYTYNRVLTLIDRDSGEARSFVLTEFTGEEIQRIFNENVAKEAYLLTDDAHIYKPLGKQFTFHGYTNHGDGEYVRKDAPWVHTNTVEGYYSVFKRGMKGVYQHCTRWAAAGSVDACLS